MKRKSLIENKKGNAAIIITGIFVAIVGFAMLVLGNYLYFAIASSADAGKLIAVPGTRASGSLTFSGNTTTNELVNITNGVAIYRFEFNASYMGPSACNTNNCIIVNVNNTNTSIISATNLTNAINNNASVAAFLTASNSVTNVTRLTYISRGTVGNAITISTNGLNITTSGSTLSNGVNDVTGQASQTSLNDYVTVTLPLFGLALMILGFAVVFISLKGGEGGEGRQ